MIVIKIIFLLVSTFTTIASMKMMSKLPNKEFTPKENVKRMHEYFDAVEHGLSERYVFRVFHGMGVSCFRISFANT